MPDIFFDGYENLIRIAISAPVIYCAVILFIRMSGKRSTSQMNNFDWVVTVALGSLVGAGLVQESVTVAETVLAIGLLMALQYLFTRVAWHAQAFENVIKAEPALLLEDGRFLRSAMRRERVTEAEILAAIRENGLRSVGEAQWVILESDASFSVIARSDDGSDATALANVADASAGPRGETAR